MKVLLLAGTAEARALAARLEERVDLVVSLAGATKDPAAYCGAVRFGGFGGVDGLAAYLRAEGVGAVVDATHPFAAGMTRNAVAACATGGVAYLRLERPGWDWRPGWTAAGDMVEAVAALPAGARVFLATGSGTDLRPVAARGDIRAVLRVIELPGGAVPDNVEVVTGRPPFSVAAEVALLRDHGITHLVTKNAGGDAGVAKLDAADELGLPVLMIARPGLPDGVAVVADVAAAEDWVREVAAC